jgi:murein DD-endopeptidase MepM/ murein hydrolase activator NlpD
MKKLFLVILIFSFIFVWVLPIQADTLSDYKNKKTTVSNKLDSITKKEKVVKQQINQKIDEKQNLLDAQKKTAKEFQLLQAQKDYLAQQQKEIDAALVDSEQKYSDQKDLLKKRLKVMYENSSISYIDTLLESKSIIDFFDRLQLISLIAKSDKDLVSSLESAKKDVEFKKNITDAQKRDTDNKANLKAKTISQISISRANVEGDLQQYKSTLDELQRQEDELSKQSEEINQEIKKIMSKNKYSGGIMRWPSPSCTIITSPYGMRFHPILKKNELHTGIDIGARMGASTIAAASGIVIVAGWKTGYGNTIIIDHGGGVATLYGHSSRLLVSVGDRVKAGQTIAKVGSTGWSTGPHLHFEVRINGSPVNPLKYVTSR